MKGERDNHGDVQEAGWEFLEPSYRCIPAHQFHVSGPCLWQQELGGDLQCWCFFSPPLAVCIMTAVDKCIPLPQQNYTNHVRRQNQLWVEN